MTSPDRPRDLRTTFNRLRLLVSTLRFRIALWITLLLLVVLVAFSIFVYRSLERSLTSSADNALRFHATQFAGLVTIQNGNPTLQEKDPNGTFADQLNDPSITVRLLNIEGAVLYATGTYRELSTPADVLASTRRQHSMFSMVTDPIESDDLVRLYTTPVLEDEEVIGFVQTAQSFDSIEDTLDQLAVLLLVGVPAFVIVAGIGGYWLATRALRPIDHITETTQRISADDLSMRLESAPTNDEVGRLVATLNTMLSRLDNAFQRERQFTADASHELRTPLTTIRTILEMTLSKQRDAEDYEQALDDIYDETHRLQSLVENLLILAREDSQYGQSHEIVNLSNLLLELTETMRPFAETKGLSMACEVDEAMSMTGDSIMLRRLFTNLIDNAIKYTEQGDITIQGKRSDADAWRITITDTGIGISPHHLHHIFERFYRVETARSTPGTGLGLTIAQRIVHRHGGTIDVHSTANQGTIVTVTLPSSQQTKYND